MELIARIAQVIVPVFLIVAIGYGYARRAQPDMAGFNRIVLDVLTPVIVYTALAGKEFHWREQLPLLLAGALLILLTGLVAWGVARVARTQPRTLVPVVMFTNCGNMGLPLALLAFGPEGFGAAVALFSISNLIHFSLGSRITSAQASTRELLGDAMVPLMLFALGVRLTQLRRRDVPRGLLGAFARPLVGIAVAVPLTWALGLEGTARAQLLLFAALPPAVMQFLLAERYGQEPERVAAMILLGNALAVLFVPLGLALGL